ncbi:MAG: Na+/H+ antiporter [Flavipsychrobacter sp.]|jgi:CPA1 family monovalent cation:H+ antiporter|nr:Na+/H+ antiporter [Flavipsychrobacter sp.]
MHSIEVIVLLLVVIIVLSAFVEWLKIPQATMLVFAGLIIGFLPHVPELVLKPDAVFLVFLPPLLYTAAWRLSWHDFRAERRSILSLATGLVFFSVVTIAVVAHYFIPGFSWQLGFLLGAVISPPDAVAATSVTRGLNLNRRVVSILEGESLVNDASALVAYRYAIASIVTGSFVMWQASVQFIWVALGGVGIGLALGWLFRHGHKRITDNATLEVALTLLTPYVAYLLAEHFHASGVLAVVTAGLYLSHRSHESITFQTRMQATSVWITIEFLLTGFVFILIGMQLPSIVKNIETDSLLQAFGYGVLITTVAILVRILWVFPGAYLPLWIANLRKKHKEKIDWRYVLVISWAGMRGVVSLAAAMAIPLTLADGSAFPQRDMILFITFCVIFLTLVVHGLSLRLLIKRLKIRPDLAKAREEENEVRKHISTQAIAFIEANIADGKYDEEVVHRLRTKYEINLRLVSEKGDAEKPVGHRAHMTLMQYARAQKHVLDFERQIIIRLHKEAAMDSDVLKKLEHEMDIEESRLSEQLKRAKADEVGGYRG